MKVLSLHGAYALYHHYLRLLQTFSWRRFSNYLCLQISYAFSVLASRPYHWGLPVAVSIEPTTACNLQCPECPSGTGKLNRRSGKMNFGHYKKIIEKLPSETSYLTLYFQGEPYLNSHIFDMISLAKQRRMFVTTSTNGHFLDSENALKTIKSGLDKIIISLDAADSETYLNYRKGGNFEKLTAGISNLTSMKRELKSHSPLVVLQFLVFRQNEHQIADAIALGRKLDADILEIKSAQHYHFIDGNPCMTGIEKYSRYRKLKNGKYEIKGKMHNRCFRIWSSCVITWDGNVVPCCYDKDAVYCFGNLLESGFLRIWDGKYAKAFRKKIFLARKEIDICRNCLE